METKKLLPKNSQIVDESFELIDARKIKKKYILEKFSDSFESMERKAYEIYMDYQNKAEKLSKEDLIKSKDLQIKKVKASILNHVKKNSGISDGVMSEFVNGVGDIFWDGARQFEFSAGQSRKSRAGKALEMILMRLFKIADIPCEKPKGKTGKKFNNIDLLVPDLQTANTKTEKATFLSIKRTLRERWKQADQEAKRGWTVYLITLDEDISTDLAEEIQNSGLYVYVKDSMKKKFPKLDRIRGLSELPNDLSQYRK